VGIGKRNIFIYEGIEVQTPLLIVC